MQKTKSSAKRTPKKSQSATEIPVESPAVPVTQIISTEDMAELLFLHLNRLKRRVDCHVWVKGNNNGEDAAENDPKILQAVSMSASGKLRLFSCVRN